MGQEAVPVTKQRVAVVGSGIAGLSAAFLLNRCARILQPSSCGRVTTYSPEACAGSTMSVR